MEPEAPLPPSRPANPIDQFRETIERYVDIPTLIFGVGTLMVVFFLFLPLIDLAKVSARKAAVEESELTEKRNERVFKEKKDKQPADEDARNKGREAAKSEKEKLQEEADSARLSADQWHTQYRRGMMLGFWVLAIGALGFLQPSQPTIKRVVGAIVITAEVLLIFIAFVMLAVKLL